MILGDVLKKYGLYGATNVLGERKECYKGVCRNYRIWPLK